MREVKYIPRPKRQEKEPSTLFYVILVILLLYNFILLNAM